MLGNISPLSLALVLALVVLIFGTKKIRSLGSDFGAALRGFRKGLTEDEPEPRLEADPPAEDLTEARKESSEKH